MKSYLSTLLKHQNISFGVFYVTLINYLRITFTNTNMNFIIITFLIIGGLSFLGLVFIILSKIIVRRIRRRDRDKPIIESHKMKLRPPTWKFQKYHPSKCPHHNGIYRETFVDSFKKTTFVCADCVDVIEVEEVKQRDKFKV